VYDSRNQCLHEAKGSAVTEGSLVSLTKWLLFFAALCGVVGEVSRGCQGVSEKGAAPGADAAFAQAAAAPTDAPGGFWPQFHGPVRDNMSTETGLAASWPEGGPPLLWTFAEAGRGYAGVSVAEGRIYTSGDFEDTECVMALDLAGRLLWKSPNGESWRGSTPGSRNTPTWVDGLLYHLGPHGRLACLEAATGKEIWAVDIIETFAARLGPWALAENLVVEGDLVLATPGGEKGRIVALDRRTGRTVWANTTITDRQSYASPIAVTHGGVRQFINLLERTVVGVAVDDGRLLWSHPHPNRYNQNSTRPVYAQGRVFVTSGHKGGGRVIELAAAPGKPPREAWFNEEFDNCHGGILVRGGYLYGSGCRLYHKGLICADLATGRTVYRHEDVGKVSLTWADGHIYGFDQDGRMMLIRAEPDGAAVVSAFRIPWQHKDQSLSHPVVSGGRLYLRHGANLFCYDVRGKGE
jgi:outer membrane protein assembly factor BamB